MFLIGHSMITSLSQALAELKIPKTIFYLRHLDSLLPLSLEEIDKHFPEEKISAPIIMSVFGAEHRWTHQYGHFDFMSTAEDSLEKNREILPRSIVQTRVATSLNYFKGHLPGIIESIRKRSKLPIYFLAPAPPCPCLDESIDDSVVLKVWRMTNALRRQICTELGLNYIEVPVESLDANGFLREELRRGDGWHGNKDFGHIQLKLLQTLKIMIQGRLETEHMTFTT